MSAEARGIGSLSWWLSLVLGVFEFFMLEMEFGSSAKLPLWPHATFLLFKLTFVSIL